MGGGQYLERPNVETVDISGFRNLEFLNNESRVIRFFDFRIYSLCLWLFKLFEHSYLCMTIYIKFEIFEIWIALQIVKFWKFANFWHSTISEIWLFYEFIDNGNLMIFEIVKMGNFWNFF